MLFIYKYMDKDIYNYIYKFIIVGDSFVGKSCLLLRFVDLNFRNQHDLTIGVEFGSKIINISDNNNNNEHIPIKLHIWDTAGQELFKSIIRSYYRGAIGAILVYDISRRETYDNIIFWLNDVKKNNNMNIQYILVGNKSDLERKVSYEEAFIFAENNGLLYIESSAKENINIDNIFIELTKKVYENVEINEINQNNICGIYINKIKNTSHENNCCF